MRGGKGRRRNKTQTDKKHIERDNCYSLRAMRRAHDQSCVVRGYDRLWSSVLLFTKPFR